jgi:hypothetical protein
MHRTASGLLVVATMLASCSSVTDGGSAQVSRTADPSLPSAPSASAASLLPLGRYVAEVPPGVEAAPGTWRMTITENGITWVNPLTGSSFSPGDVLDVSSTTIVLAPDPQCPDQGADATTGTYGWEFDGSVLTFALEADSCAGRRDTLTAAPWTITP